jgi:hypothetical protein
MYYGTVPASEEIIPDSLICSCHLAFQSAINPGHKLVECLAQRMLLRCAKITQTRMYMKTVFQAKEGLSPKAFTICSEGW